MVDQETLHIMYVHNEYLTIKHNYVTLSLNIPRYANKVSIYSYFKIRKHKHKNFK